MDLRYLLFPGQRGTCLAGFIAGKRLGKAHERNLIKRRMREAYRQHQHLVRDIAESEPVGFHGLFIAKKAGTPYLLIEEECIRLLAAVQKKMQETAIPSQ
jgi:RNase P protein component